MPETVVIGAGVIGSSIGLELARSGREVVVIDRGPGPGTGSTSASAACIRFHYSTWEGVALAWESKFAWTDWRGHLGVTDPTGMASYIRTGVLVLDFPGFDARRTLAFYAEAGIPVEELSAAQVRERFPTLDPGRHHPPRALDDEAFWSAAAGEIGGWWTPDGGYVDDPQLAAHNLLHAAVVQGARVRFNTTVDAIRRDGDRVCGVLLSDGSTLPADIVVNAAGPHSGVVNELAGVADEFRVRTRPLRQEVHSVPATHVPPRAASLPMVGDGDLGTYFRPQPGGGLLIGGQEPECDPLVWLDDPDRYDAEPTSASYEAQVTRVARRMPELSVPSRVRGIVGVYDVSDDWIPIYDRTSLAGYYVAIGTSGNQFKNAPAVGQLMRRLVDACESGHPHDVDPVQWTTPVTHLAVDLGHYSRLRSVNAQSSNSVLG